jgi:hypothetical protein
MKEESTLTENGTKIRLKIFSSILHAQFSNNNLLRHITLSHQQGKGNNNNKKIAGL